MIKQYSLFLALSIFSLSTLAYAHESHPAKSEEASYCIKHGGTVTTMHVEYGSIVGISHKFCNFIINKTAIGSNEVSVGLKAYASKKPSIAASMIKTLPAVGSHLKLIDGTTPNAALNLCKNLGGSEISYSTRFGGGFVDKQGNMSDMCVFGDGSMVSAWSLIYMSNNYTGFDKIKKSVRSKPLALDIPTTHS